MWALLSQLSWICECCSYVNTYALMSMWEYSPHWHSVFLFFSLCLSSPLLLSLLLTHQNSLTRTHACIHYSQSLYTCWARHSARAATKYVCPLLVCTATHLRVSAAEISLGIKWSRTVRFGVQNPPVCFLRMSVKPVTQTWHFQPHSQFPASKG